MTWDWFDDFVLVSMVQDSLETKEEPEEDEDAATSDFWSDIEREYAEAIGLDLDNI